MSNRESSIGNSDRKRQQQLYQNTTPQTNHHVEIFQSITGQQIARIDSEVYKNNHNENQNNKSWIVRNNY